MMWIDKTSPLGYETLDDYNWIIRGLSLQEDSLFALHGQRLAYCLGRCYSLVDTKEHI
jgi:hypothetical protein